MASDPTRRTAIHSGWSFREAKADNDDESWRPVSQFPTTIHQDLLHHGLIPDPTRDLNAQDVQCVGEKAWAYRTTFGKPAFNGSGARHVLVFDGLDTFVIIKLNDVEILRTDNMFLQYRLDVTDLLEADNVLELTFLSAFLEGKQLEKDQGFKNLFWNGDSSRMKVRKIGCHYGWDWGPTLMTCGPWRSVYLESFVARIKDFHVDIEVADGLDSAMITVSVDLDGTEAGERSVTFRVVGPDNQELDQHTVRGSCKYTFIICEPQLWYPTGYGEQALYTISADIADQLDSIKKRVGIRLSELVQRPIPGKEGTTFFFRINNIPVFCQGTNWIPPDTFLPRMTPERYRSWLELALQGNQNMIRVWGGGTYEDDVFYDICDELGILIWHDFMLGCGAYPFNDKLLKSISAEAEYNLRRTRNHPCIVLWCGNNEDHMFAELHHLEYDRNEKDPQKWLKKNWPARYYYEKTLKDLCAELVPRIPYHFGSPWGGTYSNDQAVGDMHSWRVWMADQPRHPYQEYENITGRFVSEYGMKSYPSIRTLEQLISDPKQRHPQSSTLDAWHMAPEDQRTLALYLNENFRHGTNLDEYVYATQLLQAEAMSFAVRAFRRLWQGPGREECSGSLIWQLNDCFPAVSWSLADVFMRPKLAYYVTKREYAPIVVGMSRRVIETPKDEFTKVHVSRKINIEVWASNLTTAAVNANLELSFFEVGNGTLLAEKSNRLLLLPNRSTELYNYDFAQLSVCDPSNVVVSARLVDVGDKVKTLARFVDWPQPLRHLELSKPEISVKSVPGTENGTFELRVEAKEGVAKAVELSIDTKDDEVADSYTFSDNCLDLVPRDVQHVQVKYHGREPRDFDPKIRARHLGSQT